MKVYEKKCSELTEYAQNPRKNDQSVSAVMASIKEFGFKVPIIIDKDGVIVAGHTRLKAAKKLGMETVPCIIADDLTEEQIKAFRIADNKTAELADWDFDLLAAELKDLSEIDMSEFGFDMSAFEEPEEVVEDDYDYDQPVESRVKEKEIWVLGAHRLMCGDSTDPEDMSKLIRGGCVNLYLTDPPYNIDYTGKTSDALKIQNDHMEDESFRKFLVSAFNAAKSVMAEGAAFYIWHADSEGYNFRGACRDVDWKVRECLIWSKNTFTLGRQDYQWQHEPCLYGWNEGTHNWYSDRKQTTILEFDKPMRSSEHPTMKPVPLFAYLIQNSSKKNDIVLDSFGGSGTTLIACEQLGRQCRMMELDPHYCDVIINRWEQLTGQKAVLLND